jgi:hypothetical protein
MIDDGKGPRRLSLNRRLRTLRLRVMLPDRVQAEIVVGLCFGDPDSDLGTQIVLAGAGRIVALVLDDRLDGQFVTAALKPSTDDFQLSFVKAVVSASSCTLPVPAG